MIGDRPELVLFTGKTAYVPIAAGGITYMYREVLRCVIGQLLSVLAEPINHHDKQAVALPRDGVYVH